LALNDIIARNVSIYNVLLLERINRIQPYLTGSTFNWNEPLRLARATERKALTAELSVELNLACGKERSFDDKVSADD
jgi:hypothetical protein